MGDKSYTVRENNDLLSSSSSLDDDDQREWNRHQLLAGNRFLDNMENRLFVLGKKQQEIISAVQYVVAEKDEIIQRRETEHKKITNKMDEIMTKMDEILREKEAIVKEKDAIVMEKDKIIMEKDKIIQHEQRRRQAAEKICDDCKRRKCEQ